MKVTRIRDRFPVRFSRAARLWILDIIIRALESGCPVVSLLPDEYTNIGFFWGLTSGLVSVFLAAWFNSAFMLMRRFLEL